MAGVTLDSEAAFKERCDKVGLNNDVFDELTGQGYKTFGSMAFAVGASPTSISEEDFQNWVRNVFATAPNHHQLSCLRRILFESQALGINDMKTRVEPTTEILTRKMPTAERLSRQKAQEKRLPGVIFDPQTTPSHRIVDQIVEMLETGVLAYIPPGKFTSREQEIQASKPDKTLAIDADGNLKIAAKGEDLISCDTGSELTLRQAWSRRSLAFDIAGMASYATLEGWSHKLYVVLQRPAPPGYHPIALTQIVAADRHMFTLAASNLLGQLQPQPGQPKPLDKEIKRLSDSPEVLQFLTHLPQGGSSKRAFDEDGDWGRGRGRGRGRGKGRGPWPERQRQRQWHPGPRGCADQGE